jgi:hypothetical protein
MGDVREKGDGILCIVFCWCFGEFQMLVGVSKYDVGERNEENIEAE